MDDLEDLVEAVFGRSVAGAAVGVAFLGVFLLLWLLCWANVFGKAGYSRWLALLMVVPVINAFWFLIFAFSRWPVLRAPAAAVGGPSPQPFSPPVAPQPPRTATQVHYAAPDPVAHCPQCGAPLTSGDRFCGRCGFRREG